MDVVSKNKAVREVKFQRDEFLEHINSLIDEFVNNPDKYSLEDMLIGIKEIAIGYFDIAAHGIEEHI